MKIIADTATLLSPSEGKAQGMTIIPVCVAINDMTYKDYMDISSDQFCGDEIESKFRHHYVECKCGACFVDGGHDYLRHGYKEEGCYTDLSICIPRHKGANTPRE